MGTIKNGSNKYGFNIIGTPNIIGSLILKRLSNNANFPNSLFEEVLEKNHSDY